MNIIAIVEARMNSTRLPGKVLINIEKKKMIDIILKRISLSKLLTNIIIATTKSRTDEVLFKWLKKNTKYQIYRGSTNDVLSRFYYCAKLYKADIIVRVTADDPLKDSKIIDKAIKIMLFKPQLDYCSNTLMPTYPEGLDIEVIRFAALEKAFYNSKLFSEREHVTPYIWKNPNLFNLYNFKYIKDLSNWRWTVDEKKDIEFIKRVFKNFKNNFLVDYEKVIKWIIKNNLISKMNFSIPRNFGYKKSKKKDQNI